MEPQQLLESEVKDQTPPLMPETWLALTGGYAKDMTLRDYFAAIALQGLLAADKDMSWDEQEIALAAYSQADVMVEIHYAAQ